MTIENSLESLSEKAFQDCDVLITLHAGRSADLAKRFREAYPDKSIIVAITGTDIHVEMKKSARVERCLRLADRIVMLEPEGKKLLASDLKKKVEVVFQSASPLVKKPKQLTRFFEVSIVGHLRPVKDPFRVAEAVKLLPKESRIRAVQFGKALEPGMKRLATKETLENRRYRWLGAVSHYEAQKRMVRSHLTVLTSKVEGAPSSISEALVNDVPILATRITAMIGMLGADHPGLFDVGDTQGLAQLMLRAEQSKSFYASLIAAGKKRKQLFKPAAEMKRWRELMRELAD